MFLSILARQQSLHKTYLLHSNEKDLKYHPTWGFFYIMNPFSPRLNILKLIPWHDFVDDHSRSHNEKCQLILEICPWHIIFIRLIIFQETASHLLLHFSRIRQLKLPLLKTFFWWWEKNISCSSARPPPPPQKKKKKRRKNTGYVESIFHKDRAQRNRKTT